MRNYNTARTYFETVLCNHPTENCEIVPTLKDIRITASYEDENYIGFDGISTSKEGGCKHCGQYISMIKDYKSSCTTIGKYNSKNVILRLVKTMYYCSDCQASTTERLLDVTGNQQKNRWVPEIYDRILERDCHLFHHSENVQGKRQQRYTAL